MKRVETRVIEGGHNIPEDVIKRRYISGIKNLFELYVPICNYWMIFDNSNPTIELIAEGSYDKDIVINDRHKYDLIKQITKL